MSFFSLVLPHSVRIITIDMLVHSRSSLENHTRIQTQMGKVYTCFQTKKAPKNHTLWGGTYQYGLYKGVTPPPTPPPGREKILASRQVGCESKAYASFVLYLKVFIYFFMIYALNIFTTENNPRFLISTMEVTLYFDQPNVLFINKNVN